VNRKPRLDLRFEVQDTAVEELEATEVVVEGLESSEQSPESVEDILTRRAAGMYGTSGVTWGVIPSRPPSVCAR
jgi:hypothetical protein